MANNYVSKVNLGGTIYSLKDAEVRAAVAALETALASSLVFKGIVSSAAEITELTNYKLGWTYKANASFSLDSVGQVENGDMIICINSNSTYSASDWTIVQNNVDVMIGANNTSAGTKGLVPTPSAGDDAKFLCGDGTWQKASVAWGSFSDLY